MVSAFRFNKRVHDLSIFLGFLTVFVSACTQRATDSFSGSGIVTEQPAATQTMTPFQPAGQSTEVMLRTPIPDASLPAERTDLGDSGKAITFWRPPYLPEALGAILESLPAYTLVESPDQAVIRISVGRAHPIGQWIYALAAPYPTLRDGLEGQALRDAWLGHNKSSLFAETILVDQSTYGVFSAFWGKAAEGAVRVVPNNELVDTAWSERPSLAIIPFEALEPRWKVLEVDGQSPLRHDFNPESYPLTVPISLEGDEEATQEMARAILAGGDGSANILLTNREADKITTVALTGVTALVRATAFTMRRRGITYPARDIGALLRSANITHISNEIPFTPDCPPPNPTQEGLRFCSDPAYIALLDEVGTDIVELTGDHFGDWGPEAMRFTLDLYTGRGWPYYGGGYDSQDARQARLMDVNGNRLAFIGCNAKGGGYATAGLGQPGAIACDYDWMEGEIKRLREAGYLVIATFQHFEYYTYAPQPAQVQDFRRIAEAGAVVVSGSQAHQPQGMEFYRGAFIHYGLGNLFFDQYHYCDEYACDESFIDLHIFYNGRYLGNELITIVFEDYARPRLMTADERQKLLAKIFSASGW